MQWVETGRGVSAVVKRFATGILEGNTVAEETIEDFLSRGSVR
jgi:hypothetical protein